MTAGTARSLRLRRAVALAASVLCHGAGQTLASQESPAPSVERIVTLPNLAGTPPTAPAWSADSRRVAFLWNDHGMPFRDVWVTAVDSGEPMRLTYLAPDPADVLGPGDDLALDAVTERAGRREAGGISQAVWDPSGEQLLFVHRGEVHAVSADGGPPVVVLRGGRLQFSPDGQHLAFLRGGDLWVRHQEEGREE
jgi:dipeptidyl-peptidase 4